MLKGLPPATQALLEEVRKRTGKDVSVKIVPELPSGLAQTRIAWEGLAPHYVYIAHPYRDLAGYLVAHECGHILRFFAAPEPERKVPVSDARAQRLAWAQLRAELGDRATLISSTLSQMLEMWYHGLIHQLTSQPADMMIERWLYLDFPELRSLQRQGLDLIHRQTVLILDPEIARITPPKVYGCSVAMNHAFFLALDRVLGTAYAKPFEKTPFASEGRKLLELAGPEPWDSLAGDIRVATAWARHLGLTGWFSWVHYKNVPRTS